VWWRGFWSRPFWFRRFWPGTATEGGPPFDVDICDTTIEEFATPHTIEAGDIHTIEDLSTAHSIEDLATAHTIESFLHTIEECPT
jgi:hypothetical protein